MIRALAFVALLAVAAQVQAAPSSSSHVSFKSFNMAASTAKREVFLRAINQEGADRRSLADAATTTNLADCTTLVDSALALVTTDEQAAAFVVLAFKGLAAQIQ